jgi:ABC-type lipoprotein export system ATPase subunit
MRRWLATLGMLVAIVGCSREPSSPAAAAPAPAQPKLGIRPHGDTEIQIDLAKIQSEELKKVFAYIDEHVDDHVVNLQKWIRQPSISNSGEGIPESAEMVKGFFDQLGCQESRVYDVGITEWGAPGNPVVYARCDEGAPRTIAIYWQYDTMPVTQPDAWIAPPFEGRIVEQPPFKKVLIGRGAVNSKGPELAQWQALMSIKAVTGKLPVNIVFVAEGDEERMDIGLRKFVKDHPDFFKNIDALIGEAGTQSPSGGGGVGGGSEGCVYFELTTSGKSWGRGPVKSDIHGSNKRSVDSPAWRHMKMLTSLISDDGNTPLVKGFLDGLEPMTADETNQLKAAAARVDLKVAAENVGVARFISEDPFTMLKMQRYGTSFNLDGIWGGNMYAGEAQHPLFAEDERDRDRQALPRAARSQRLQGRRAEDHRRRAVGEDVVRHRYRPCDDADVRPVQHPAQPAVADADDSWRLLARLPVLEPGSRRESGAHLDADRHGRRRPRRRRARGQRVHGDRRRRQGLRVRGRAEVACGDLLQLRRQERAGAESGNGRATQNRVSTAGTALIATQDITKTYAMEDAPVHALRGVTLDIRRGEFVAVVGPSGSGKSTFMHILGCLDRPTSGRYLLDGRDVSHLSDDELSAIRNRQIGFVFQGFNLLARTSALENVELPLLYAHDSRIAPAERRRRAMAALAAVGLQDRAEHHPNQLSGGQQQRVAIARALLNDPAILLADEPTGNLDSRTSVEVMDIFQRLKDERGITIVLITHEPQVAEYGSRIIRFKDGRVVSDQPNTLRRTAAAELEAVALAPAEDA